MKKLLAILLTGVLLLGMVGCQGSTPKLDAPSFASLSMTPGETYSSYDGIEIRINSLDWHKDEKKTTLVVVWKNRTEYEVTYGAAFTIERLDGEEWVSCAIPEDPVFNLMAYLLPAGRLTNESYTLTDMFDVSSPGTYRFKTDCYVYETSDKSVKCELIAEFTVGNVKCPDDSKKTGTEVQWCAQYIRTDGYQDGAKFPKVQIIGSLQDLKDYYTTYQDLFDMERKDEVYSDTTIGFLDACDQYDEAFFGKNFLVFVLLEEGSGSVRHEIRGVEQTADKKLSISVDRKVPEVGTDDMAQWHVILELSRDVIVETPNDVLVYLDGNLAWNGSVVEPSKPGATFTNPPDATLSTPEGDVALTAVGYDWTHQNADGTETTTIADQASRPLPQSSMNKVAISSKYAETVYAPVPDSDTYAPTNSLGNLVKMNWEVNPTSVTYTCWPESVWQKSNTPDEKVVSQQDHTFYAKPGGYVYEIVATWEDAGAGYHGTANYYVYIVDVDDYDDGTHEHMTALRPQTVAEPITGYCGNTQTTLYIGDKDYTFAYSHSVTLTDILVNLDYNPDKVCRCMAQYKVDTEFGANYQIHLEYGFVRCEKGQADLTQEQIDQIAAIIEWAETTNCQYPENG